MTIRHFFQNKILEAGQSIILIAFVMVGLISVVGLAVDGGMLFQQKSLLDARADAAALAGGRELTLPIPAQEKAMQYLYLNGVSDVSQGGNTTIDIQFGKNKVDNDVIVVDLYRQQQLFFLPILGMNTAQIHSHAAVFATSMASDQTWSMFRGGCGRTGYQDGSWSNSYNIASNGDFKLGYQWGFRWGLNGDMENHRSTPAVAMHPSIANGQTIAYIGTNGGGPGTGGVFAFNTVISSTLWYQPLNTMVRSSPYFLDDPAVINVANQGYPMVIVAGHNGHEYALDARDGSIVWDTPGISSDVFESNSQKYRSSPTYSCGAITIGGTTYDGVIFNATYGGNVYAYNAETGAILWRSTPIASNTTSWITTNNDSLALSRTRVYGPIYGTVNFAKDAAFTTAGYSQGVLYAAAFGNNGNGGGTNSWIWDNGSRNSPLDYTFAAGERTVQREIVPNAQKGLVFDFKKNADTNPGNYNIEVWFDGCGADVLTLSPADNSACGGTITSTLSLSFNGKQMTLPIFHGADAAAKRISRVWISWPDGNNKDLKNIFFEEGAGGSYPNSPYIFAINVATGERVWYDVLDDYVAPAVPSDRNSNAIAKIDTNRDGTPDEWRVYANPTDNFLYAYNAITGARLWRKDTGAQNHRSDMAIYRNIVFGGNNSGVYALDAVDGFSIWDNVDSDGAGTADKVNPNFGALNPGGGSAYNAFGVRLIPGGVKSAPAVVDGIVMVGANKTSLGAGNAGSMWGLWWETGRDMGHYDTNTYNGDGPFFGGGSSGDVRSGVVVGPDGNVYFGARDGALYQLYVTRRLVLIE